jgi:hypothetical protein
VQAAVAGNVHPTMPAIMTATTPVTMPVTMPVKQVEGLKRSGRDSGEPATADLETGSRGGSDHGEQPLLAAHASVRRLTDEAVGS